MPLHHHPKDSHAVLESLAHRRSYDPRVEGPRLARSLRSPENSFKSCATDILAGRHKITAGSVHLIGLDDIREELGERWDGVKDRVHGYAERLFHKFLSPQDHWFRHGDDHYIIAFALTDKTAAQLICSKIVEHLHRSLLGHADTRRITVTSAVMTVDGRVALDSARLEDVLRNAVAGLENAEETAGPATPAPGPAAAAPAFHPNVRFRPIFDVQHKVVSTFVSRPAPDTARFIHGIMGFEAQHEEAAFALDMESLAQSVGTYNELYANKFRYAQTITVHFATMASARRRREYVEACRAIPHHLLPFLAFELEGLPHGVPLVRLAEIVAMLRPFGRAVMVMTRDEDLRDLPGYAKAGIKGVGIRLDIGEAGQPCVERMQAFCQAARRFGMFTYVDGVRTAAQLAAAEAAGAAYLCGPMIGEDAEVPEHMRRCTEQQMIRRFRVRANRSP